MKRVTRAMSEKTRAKISKKLTGRPKGENHKRRISEGMKRYWQSVSKE